MSIVFKNRILGYYYLNASKADKLVSVYFQVTQSEAYQVNITFPKCRISYAFLFRHPQNNLIYISAKSANTLEDAMDQTYFSIREPLQVIAVGDPEKRSINFVSIDATDQNIDDKYFEPNCVPTEAERRAEEIVRQAVIDGNASTIYNYFFVDGPMTAIASVNIIPGLVSLNVTDTEQIKQLSLVDILLGQLPKPIVPISLDDSS